MDLPTLICYSDQIHPLNSAVLKATRRLRAHCADRRTGMPPKADPVWEKHTEDVTKEEEKAGIIITVKGWMCN